MYLSQNAFSKVAHKVLDSCYTADDLHKCMQTTEMHFGDTKAVSNMQRFCSSK